MVLLWRGFDQKLKLWHFSLLRVQLVGELHAALGFLCLLVARTPAVSSSSALLMVPVET